MPSSSSSADPSRPPSRRTRGLPKRLLLWAIVFVGVPALLLELARYQPIRACPCAYVFGLWAVYLIVAGIRRRRRDGRGALAFNMGVLFLALAVAEVYLGVVAKTPTGLARRASPGTYVQRDAHLGFRPVPGSRSRFTKVAGGETVFDVTYTIAEDGLRIRPPLPSPPPTESILLFGCSFTYGTGVQDDETLSWQLEERLGDRFRVYNFAFEAYGPHQMLADLESDRVRTLVEYPPRHAVFIAISDHARRVNGRAGFGRHEPRFVVGEDGSVTRRGMWGDDPGHLWGARLRQLAHHSHVGRALRKALDPDPNDIDLMIAIIDAARDRLKAAWPSCSFTVLLWDGKGDVVQEIERGLENAGIEVLHVSDMLPDHVEHDVRYRIHPHDSHPSAAANARIAERLAEILERGE